jgi:hypothetical protein
LVSGALPSATSASRRRSRLGPGRHDDVVDVLERERRDRRDASRALHDQALARDHAQRLAQRVARDPERGRELGLAQRLAGREHPAEDQAAYRLGGLLGRARTAQPEPALVERQAQAVDVGHRPTIRTPVERVNR